MKKNDLAIDDLVRVVQSQGGLGPTLYVVEYVSPINRHSVVIREAGNPLAGGQAFDASLLRKVPR